MLAERVISWTEEWKQQGLTQGIEQGIEQGRELGIEQGREQGREEGIVLADASTLRRLLARRFGSLSEENEEKISQATKQQLESWLDNILDAKTLDEVFKS